MRRSSTLARLTFVLMLVACGSRTGLPIDDTFIGSGDDDGNNPGDASRKDGTIDGGGDEDGQPMTLDALPPLDVQPIPDVFRNDCPDADAELIYVITTDYQLFSFYPPDGSFTRIGPIKCPTTGLDPMGNQPTPFSMAVNRKGIAYTVFNDGELFRVGTATAACISTGYQTNQQNVTTFGMSFSTDNLGPTETLFVATDDATNSANPSSLGWIDLNTFKLNVIGQFNPTLAFGELAGTGDGHLYAFYPTDPTNTMTAGSYIVEINKSTGAVTAQVFLPDVTQGSAWAFGFWGGDFYMFTSPDGMASIVQRYRPSDGTTTQVATLPSLIVGAGVSTCAPEQ
jgi:hypothetical protein